MSEVFVRAVATRSHGRATGSSWCHDPFVARLKNIVDLNGPELESLREVIQSKLTIKKRRDLILDGYEYCRLFFVTEGFAARYKLLRNGKRQIVNFVLPGDVVGLPGSFLDRAAASVVALTDMTVRSCSLEAFVRLSFRWPKFGLALSWLAAQEAAIYAEHIVDVGRRTPIERLAHLLLETHARLAIAKDAEEFAFILPFTQEMMSDALGLSVPHLNRMLAKLRKEGMIAMNERHVEFIDLKGLQQLAQFQPVRPARIPLPEECRLD
jgi:CRP-like cAMP-binding protein